MVAMLLELASLWACPGYRKPVDVKQPDGTIVTLLMHGDEFLNFMTTSDGYTVVKGEDNFYYYADADNGELISSSIIARNMEARSESDNLFLSGIKKMICPDMTEGQKEMKLMTSNLYIMDKESGEYCTHRTGSYFTPIDYNHFKGLVVLVEFNDRKFSMTNPQSFYQKLTSEKNYQDDFRTNYPVPVTGSARDYFCDNSLGMFDPTFDVVGPVTVSMKASAVGGSNMSQNTMTTIFKEVLNKVNNSGVDFSQYDVNNDGYIDIVYFIFAGYGSYVQGNNSGYLWPHANDYSGISKWQNMKYDNKYFGRYACSVEIQDVESEASQHAYLDGIGTICHEFSHVLGLMDHYDVDYEENGQANHPSDWDVMAGGTTFNYGLTPVGYNAFERTLLGFATPTVLSEAGDYELEPFNTSNQAFLVKTAKKNDEFFLENRQKTGWDTYLPGHGLLVWRADTSSPSVWRENKVNVNPDKMYYDICGHSAFTDYDLTENTLEEWGTKKAVIDLYSITESDGMISFEAGKNLYEPIVEDFEEMPLTDADVSGITGKFCQWDLSAATVENTTASYGQGQHLIKIKRNGIVTSSVLANGLRTLNFRIQNGSQKVRVYVELNTGNDEWKTLDKSVDIAKNKGANFSFREIPAGSMIRIRVLSSSSSAACYLDNIEITLPKGTTDIKPIIGVHEAEDYNGQLYNLSGQRIGNGYKGLVIKNGEKIVMKKEGLH